MAETVASSRYYDGSADGAGTRRDFLYLAISCTWPRAPWPRSEAPLPSGRSSTA